LAAIVETLGLLVGMGGIGVVMYQVFLWLKAGEWVPISVFKVVAPVLPPTFINWIVYPTDWRGVNKIINSVFDLPMSAVAIVVGISLSIFGSILDCKAEQPRRKE
jgi:hypothetical protein